MVYQKGKNNQTDFISRRAKPLSKIPADEQKETHELTNLLYFLHTTPITDKIGLAIISNHTRKDPVLSELVDLIRKGQSYIHKDANPKLRRFKNLLSEITVTGNDILMNGERIILPESLQDEALELAHRGSHSANSCLERRLRNHFFFFDMQQKVQRFMKTCKDCNVFTDKKMKEPIIPHKVPAKCWENVAVDLFGPMPSSKHIVVVQDMASRYPAAKLVRNTSASEVIPVLRDISIMETRIINCLITGLHSIPRKWRILLTNVTYNSSSVRRCIHLQIRWRPS